MSTEWELRAAAVVDNPSLGNDLPLIRLFARKRCASASSSEAHSCQRRTLALD